MKKQKWFSRWLVLPVVVLAMIAALVLGFTQASFNDIETSTASTATAWASTNWTQTTQAHFNAGVLTSVNTSASPGDVWLASSSLRVTLSPTTNTGSAWTSPTDAYSNGTSAANITSGAPSGNNVWGTYGFSANTGNITRVRVGYDAWTTANVTFQGSGAVATNSSGNVYPDLPSGWAVNDIWLCFIANRDNNVPSIASGWTSLYSVANTTSGVRTRIYWRRAVAGDTAPIVTYSAGLGISAVIVGYRGVVTTGSPFNINQSQFVKAPSTTNTFGNGATTTVNGNMIVLLSATSGNGTSSTYTGTPTPNERVDGPDINLRPELIIADYVQSAAGAMGSHNSTLTASRGNTGYQLSLKSETAQIRVDVSWDGGTTWSSKATTTTNTTELTYWYDVTAATSWTQAKLADGQLQVRVDAQSINGTQCTVNLDWLPVEVTYQQYVSSGTIASQVLNTTVTSSQWDGLFWDNSLPASTNITFEVRARNTSFAATASNATLAWIPIGGSGNGTVNVISGLPTGQYKQWRATLTTAANISTPILQEVRLYYYGG